MVALCARSVGEGGTTVVGMAVLVGAVVGLTGVLDGAVVSVG